MTQRRPPFADLTLFQESNKFQTSWVRFFTDLYQNIVAVTSYAEMFCISTDVTLTTQDTWYQVTNMQVGHADLINVSASNIKVGTGDHKVEVFASVSLASPGAGQTIRLTFGVDETPDTDHMIERDITTTSTGAVAVGGIAEVETSNGNIALFALNNTAGGITLTVNRATMIVQKMHAGD